MQLVKTLHHHLAPSEEADRRALHRVAGVNQQDVLLVLADLPNHRGATRDAAHVGLAFVALRRQDIPVQVTGVQYHNRHFTRPHRRVA
jgi:hypothetical protein